MTIIPANAYIRMIVSIRNKHSIRLFCLFLTFILFAGPNVPNGYAQMKNPGEYEVKAIFLYNFVKFIEWPDKAASDIGSYFKLCILGEDSFGAALDAIQGETVGQKKLVIKYLKTLQHLEGCRILFVSNSEENDLEHIINRLKGEDVLLVGDTEGYAQQGLHINFYMEQNKVRFEINTDAVKRSGLKFSSKLLNIGKIVHEPSKR
jgi:hypothetical protein